MRFIKKILVMPRGKDIYIDFSIKILAIFGTLMIGSASMGLSDGSTHFLAVTIISQIIYVLIGILLMNWVSNTFTIAFIKSNKLLHLISLTAFSLGVCLLFGPVNGARAWIRLPAGLTEISIQPSEFAKITVILIIAGYCGDIKRKFKRDRDFIKRPIWFIALICLIVSKYQGDFGSMAVILAISAQCFLIPSNRHIRKFQFAIKIVAIIILIFAVYILSPGGKTMLENMSILEEYQKNRFISAIDPFYDRYNTGYQLIKGLSSIASGGLFGRGFGNSINKYSDFPAANTDYILAILIEELGFAGFIFLLVLYAIIIFRLFFHAIQMKSECSRIITIGTASYLLIHIGLNVGGVTGLIPLTGVPLLMISKGGSATISFMTSIGICQAIISSNAQDNLKK